MPSQKQLKWSQLKVGITVIVASVTLGVLLFLMSGTAGLFTPRITIKSYFDNAEGLRVGAPVHALRAQLSQLPRSEGERLEDP